MRLAEKLQKSVKWSSKPDINCSWRLRFRSTFATIAFTVGQWITQQVATKYSVNDTVHGLLLAELTELWCDQTPLVANLTHSEMPRQLLWVPWQVKTRMPDSSVTCGMFIVQLSQQPVCFLFWTCDVRSCVTADRLLRCKSLMTMITDCPRHNQP